ncbi:hypothetical protein ACTFIR_005698 [Dictyostelium discoideum]
MVKLDIKKAYLHVLVDPQHRDLFRFVWKGSHYRWKTIPFGLSTAPRIFTMLLRLLFRMLRNINSEWDDWFIGKANRIEGIPFRLYTGRTNKFHSQCLTLSNGDGDKSFPILQDVKSEISHWLTVLKQWKGKEISLFQSYGYVLTTDASESSTYNQNLIIPVVNNSIEHFIKSSRNSCAVNVISSAMSETEQLQAEYRKHYISCFHGLSYTNL